MAFRSYHGGESVIRATSPGLADATITITTHRRAGVRAGRDAARRGSPVHAAAGVGRGAARRCATPSTSRSIAHAAPAAKRETIPRGSPTTATPTTSWRRRATPAAWWLVDLEGFYQLASLRLDVRATRRIIGSSSRCRPTQKTGRRGHRSQRHDQHARRSATTSSTRHDRALRPRSLRARTAGRIGEPARKSSCFGILSVR